MIKLEITHRKFATTLLLNSKFNIIVGDSGTGKTLLSKRVAALAGSKEFFESNGYKVFSEVGVLPSAMQEYFLTERGSVFILDESSAFVRTNDGASTLLASPNYFIITGRDNFNRLPYGIRSVFTLEGTPSRSRMVPVATEAQLARHSIRVSAGTTLFTEGYGLDYRLVKQKFRSEVDVISAGGKDKLQQLIQSGCYGKSVALVDWCGTAGATLFLFDRACSGVVQTVFSPSFEYELLQFDDFASRLIGRQVLDYPSEEALYERAATDALLDIAGLTYSKSADGPLAKLLSRGCVLVNGRTIRLKGIERLEWLYPELQLVTSQSCNSSLGVPRMTLE